MLLLVTTRDWVFLGVLVGWWIPVLIIAHIYMALAHWVRVKCLGYQDFACPVCSGTRWVEGRCQCDPKQPCGYGCNGTQSYSCLRCSGSGKVTALTEPIK